MFQAERQKREINQTYRKERKIRHTRETDRKDIRHIGTIKPFFGGSQTFQDLLIKLGPSKLIQLICLILAFILTSMDPETGCGLPSHQLVKKLNMEHQSTKVCIRSHFHMRQKRDFHNIFVHFQRSEIRMDKKLSNINQSRIQLVFFKSIPEKMVLAT